MRCRNYEDNEIVFFGSKGVNPITAYQDIIVPNNDILVDIDASKTIIGQNFKVVGFGETSNNPHVNLYDSDNHMFYRSYLSKETKELRGVLTSPVAKIWVGSNTYDEVHLYLYPYQVKVPSNTFLENQSGVATSLTQRLSIIKGELWYKVSHGLPLYDKVSKKIEMDAAVLKIVNEHPDVITVNNFNSSIIKHTYKCSMEIVSKYGELELSI